MHVGTWAFSTSAAATREGSSACSWICAAWLQRWRGGGFHSCVCHGPGALFHNKETEYINETSLSTYVPSTVLGTRVKEFTVPTSRNAQFSWERKITRQMQCYWVQRLQTCLQGLGRCCEVPHPVSPAADTFRHTAALCSSKNLLCSHTWQTESEGTVWLQGWPTTNEDDSWWLNTLAFPSALEPF